MIGVSTHVKRLQIVMHVVNVVKLVNRLCIDKVFHNSSQCHITFSYIEDDNFGFDYMSKI